MKKEFLPILEEFRDDVEKLCEEIEMLRDQKKYMSKDLAIKSYDIAHPEQVVAMAQVLKNHIIKNKLYVAIRNKNYVEVEGWQFAGGLMWLYPRVASVENISTANEIKWKAEVELVRLKDDKVVSRGFAICSKKETKKKDFDEYAILSMAQTRATGKAYRNLIGWVMKLAGYEATPSEEMIKVGETLTEVKVAEVKPSQVQHLECK